MTRREWWPLAAAGLLAGYAGFTGGRKSVPLRGRRASVYVYPAAGYHDDLAAILRHGLAQTGLEVTGSQVLLKPQLAGADEGQSTHPAVVAAAYEVLQEMGAAVKLGGTATDGVRENTRALAEATGYREWFPHFDEIFVDLGAEPQVPMAGFLGKEVPVSQSAAQADLVVSVGKLRTDVRHGVAAAMTNLFGVLPAWRGRRDASAAVELTRLVRPSFGIVDGIVGLEGNGPAEGAAKKAGVLVLGPDLVAVDATCCRIVGVDPWDVPYLEMAADRQGIVEESRIHQVGAPLAAVRTEFRKAELRLS